VTALLPFSPSTARLAIYYRTAKTIKVEVSVTHIKHQKKMLKIFKSEVIIGITTSIIKWHHHHHHHHYLCDLCDQLARHWPHVLKHNGGPPNEAVMISHIDYVVIVGIK